MATTAARLSALEAAVIALGKADTNLGARIDKEVAARVTGDTSLANRVTALEGEPEPIPPTPTPVPPSDPWPVPPGLASGAITLAQAVAQAPAGAKIGVPDGTWTQVVNLGGKPLGLKAINTGKAIVDVTSSGGLYTGALQGVGNGTTPLTLIGLKAINRNGFGAWLKGYDLTVQFCDFRGEPTGIHPHQSKGVIEDCKLHDCNQLLKLDPGVESGGMKAVESPDLITRRNEAWNNYGPGLWWDGYCSRAVSEDDFCHDNTHRGFHIEITDTVTVRRARAARNGALAHLNDSWAGWAAGYVISSCRNVTMDGCLGKDNTGPDVQFVHDGTRAPLPHDGCSVLNSAFTEAIGVQAGCTVAIAPGQVNPADPRLVAW